MNRKNIINFLVFQVNWAICVFGAAKGYPWLGVIFVLIWVIIHLYIHRLFVFIELPVLFFTGLIVNNFIAFPAYAQLGHLSPLWMVALWISFSTTFRHSMSWLRHKYIFASVFAFIGGPLAYFAGQKIGAINGINTLSSVMAIGIFWALVFPSILYALNYYEKKMGN